MKNRLYFMLGAAMFLLGSFWTYAEEKASAAPRNVQDVYPGLSNGAFTYAELKALPEGVLLKTEGVEIKEDTINKIIDSQPQQAREELKKNAFFVLEQEATKQILLSQAQKTAVQSKAEIPKEENALISRFFETVVFKKIEITDEELKDFYEKNRDMCGGATFEQIGASLKDYLISQKKQQMASAYIHDLGKQIPIQISDGWVKQQAVMAFDNPVDKARKSSKPSMVDFGASGCKPCDMMAPILETLRTKYEGKANVLFIHVREQQILASRYGVQSIPLQVFFDKDGKEVFRHTGFFPQDQIEKKLSELGVH
ncbi:MAG: thioredoxin family protein [Anaerohalosphaeraceae bacterium]